MSLHSIVTFITFTTVALRTTSSSLQYEDGNSAPCDCSTFVTEGDDWVYPIAWLPYVQERITFSIDAADHDVRMSLSKHTNPFDPRYLVVFQEDNTNKASIKTCHNNLTYACIDENVAESPSPYLINGTKQYYWLKISHVDFGVEIGRHGSQIPFVSFKPGFGLEIGVQWIGLSGVNTGVQWQFCDMVLKTIAQQKPSVQSSTLVENGIEYNASRANGLQTFSQLPTHCAQTAYFDIEPWWRVDLQADYIVKMVRLLNDIDDISHPLEGLTIYVGSTILSTNQQIREEAKLCGSGSVTKNEAEKNNVIVRTCDYDPGQYVYLVKHAPILKLCGVEVFGYREEDMMKTTTCDQETDTSKGLNVALVCIFCSILIVIIGGVGWLSYAYMNPSSSCGLHLLKLRNRFRTDVNGTTQASTSKYSLVSL